MDARRPGLVCERAAQDDAATTPPVVSVIVPIHNAVATLARALKSIEVQNYRPLEIIIVDDGSSQEIASVLELFPALNIRVERLETRQGAAAARNRAIDVATGEFVAFLDADDEWLPGKLHRQVQVLKANPAVALCCTEVVMEPLEIGAKAQLNGARAQGQDAWKGLLREGCIVTSSVMTRRSLLFMAGSFDPQLIVAEDQDLWIRLSLTGDVHHDAAPLTRKYETEGSLTQIHRNLVATVTLPMIETHVSRLKHRLTDSERLDILSHRRVTAGRNAYESGDVGRGLRLILSALWQGNQPLLPNLWYLASASPAARSIKRAIRRRN